MQEVTEVGSILTVSKKHKIPSSTVHGWFKRQENREVIETKSSVKKLQKQLADKDLEISILKDLLKKTNQAWLKE